VKYSKPERMETTLWTVGRDRHFGQRGGPLGAVDAASDITAYSLDWKGQFVSWHLVPTKELLVSTNGVRNATMGPQQPGDGIKRRLGTRAHLRRCRILASGGFHHGLEQG
jgi:hypothetical protein